MRIFLPVFCFLFPPLSNEHTNLYILILSFSLGQLMLVMHFLIAFCSCNVLGCNGPHLEVTSNRLKENHWWKLGPHYWWFVNTMWIEALAFTWGILSCPCRYHPRTKIWSGEEVYIHFFVLVYCKLMFDVVTYTIFA